jgi:hypothetical protein
MSAFSNTGAAAAKARAIMSPPMSDLKEVCVCVCVCNLVVCLVQVCVLVRVCSVRVCATGARSGRSRSFVSTTPC